MQRAAAVLDELVEELGMGGAVCLARVRERWHRHPGSPVARHAWPAHLNGGTLVISVDSPAWLQELGFLKAELLRMLAPHGVKDLDLRVGAVPRTVVRSAPRRHLENEELDDESRDFIVELVSPLMDRALADQVASAMRSWFLSRRPPMA